ncbi:hypothetical protein N8930_03525 [Euryarchaeota archaeon]|nr:hypothetical protein [Euryarchaeota archaeon]
MAQSTRNPWPMRLAIAGAVLLILGAFLLNSQGDAIDEAYDPRVMAVATATGAGSEVVNLEEGCYYAVTLEGENNVDLNLTRIEGSARVADAEENKICASDWFPMSADATAFIITSGWDIEQEGEYALDVTCQEDVDCANESVYLVHTNPYQFAILTSPGMLFGMASCCLGLTVLPLAGVILWLARMNQSKGSVIMMNPDGTMTQATELTPEMMAAFAKGENPLQPKVEAPFADTGIGQTEEFIDGKQSVMGGSLLTTEQVYALMRGDVEEATQQVSDPFADRPSPSSTNPVTPKKDPNTKTITSWDEGSDSSVATGATNRPKIKPLQREKPNEPSDKDWKSWDEL